MAQPQLLSNGMYPVMRMPSESGRSTGGDLAVTRWWEDATIDSGGSKVLRRTDQDASVWWATDTASFTGRAMQSSLEVAVAGDADVERRRLCISHPAQKTCALSATGFAELLLAAASTDSAHPTVNKLFVVTERDAESQTILATRRRSAPADPAPWLFHQVATHGGPVLDPVAAVRVPLRLLPGASCPLDRTTGIAASRDPGVALARRCREAGAGDHILDGILAFRRDTLRRLAASEDDAALVERLAGSVLVANPAARAPPDELALNRRGQSSLWAFGISGDVPIVFIEVASSDDAPALCRLVRAHAFWAAHGLRTALMVVHGRAGSAGSLSGDAIRALIDSGGSAALRGKPGGIFLRDGEPLDDGDRLRLRSAARIQVAVEAAWAVVDDVLTDHHPTLPYERGSGGPPAADTLIAADGGWHAPSANESCPP